MEKLILVNPLSPGDILMMSGAIRDLHLTYPNEYETMVTSPCNQLFDYNPYVTAFANVDARTIQMKYEIIHHSLRTGLHFSDGHRLHLQTELGRPIKKHSMRPEVYLSQDEMSWINQVRIEFGFEKPFWLINAGHKPRDYTLKQYPYYQKVVDLLKDKIQFVQIGDKSHAHYVLDGVLDLVGKTDLRQLLRLSYHAEGALCAVSLQMVIMQALRKPCVIVAGGREGMRWQAINDHRFIHTIGALDCCMEDGCWRSKHRNCAHLIDEDVPLCMDMIRPEDIVRAIESYYDGGRLKWSNMDPS